MNTNDDKINKSISVRLSESELIKIELKAKKQCRSISSIVRQLIYEMEE